MAIKEKGSLATTVTVSRLPDVSGNWVCNGTADDIEINEALAYVNTLGGGRVILKQGTYTLADPIVFPGNNIWLRGMGRSTIINGNGLADGENAIELVNRDSCAIKKLAIEISTAVGTRHCIFANDGCDNLIIFDITIIDSDSDGVHIEGTQVIDIHIRGLRVLDVDGYGIYVGIDAANWCDRIMIDGAQILSAGIIGIRLGRCRYSEISNSSVATSGQTGITLDACEYCDISNCLSIANTQHGILLAGAVHCLTEGCNASLNGYHGIYLDDSDECSLTGNVCTDNGGDLVTPLYDGIYIDADSTNNNAVGNHCCINDRYGIGVDGARNNLVGNEIYINNMHGIYINAAECKVSGNYVYHSGSHLDGTYHGIDLSGSADRCAINGNYIEDVAADGETQEDGIHLEDGAVDCQIIGNYCYLGMGSGICLAANNADCQIEGNFCSTNDDYGIEVLDGCDRCMINNNKCYGNANHGIYVNANDYCSIVGNICNGNTGDATDGINLNGCDYCTISSNVCTANGDDGIVIVATSTKCIVIGNQLLGNTGAALTDGGTDTEIGHNITV